MDINEFRESTKDTTPPEGLSVALQGLWWDAKGDWDKAHESAQKDEGPDGAWVHAYLHRKEGDPVERQVLVSKSVQGGGGVW